jgi:Tfp pilus assembly protein PilX
LLQGPSERPRPVRPWGRGLSDESGIALIAAIAIMLVLTVLVTSALAYTSSDSRDASRSTAGQKAYAAAEAGLNYGLAVVQKAGSNDAGVNPQPASYTDSNAYQTPLGTGANTATATYGASYNAATKVWTIKSIGSVPNPTGSNASTITRTLSETATITPPPYNFVALNTSCDNHTLLVESSGQLNVTNAMYIDSCNSPQDAFDIFGTGGNIAAPSIEVVGGWETHNGSTVTVNGTVCSLSSSSAPITNTQPAGCPVTGRPVLPDPLASKVTTPTLGTPACTGATTNQTVAYNPAVQENGAVTPAQTNYPIKFGAGTDPVHVNDVILVGTEQMLVMAAPATASPVTLTVQRGYNSTAAAHADKAAVSDVVTTTAGTAATPSPCLYTSGTVTLNPGTYYGGICIGSLSSANCDGANCSTTGATSAYNPAVQENGAVTPAQTNYPIKFSSGTDPVQVNDVILVGTEQMLVMAAPATASPVTLTVQRGYNSTAAAHADKAAVSNYTTTNVTATLTAGTYIMAGGGLRVCGASSISAPNVMIYNTQDPTNNTGFGALDQFELNTTGSVNIGPLASGPNEGLTYYQDSGLALDSTDDCNSRNNTSSPSQNQINEYDIALLSAKSSGPNGSLGSLSGSFYAPANRADFVDALSGKANLAVLTSCILINGANSTFDFNPTGLFGTNWILGPQAG